jgi:hypothetical protein
MNNDVVHLKLEYNEALEGKKDMLSSEVNLLQLLKAIKRYHIIRNQELSKRLEMQKKIKEIRVKIDLLTKLIPKPKLPKNLQKANGDYLEKEAPLSWEKHLNPLEKELKEIQEKLRELEEGK